MSVATEEVARRYENVTAGAPIAVPFPLYDENEVDVYYGTDALVAVRFTDYTVALQPEEFDTFIITPTASLIAKLDALIAGNPAEENAITIRSAIGYLTSATPAIVRNTAYTSREFDRTIRRLQELREATMRALKLAPTFVGGDTVALDIGELSPGRTLMTNEAGTAIVAGPNASEIESAQSYADIALTRAASALDSALDAQSSEDAALMFANAAAQSAAQSAAAVGPTIRDAANNPTMVEADYIPFWDTVNAALKTITLPSLVSRIFQTTRKIGNAYFLSSFRLWDSASPTKGAAFDLTGITAGQTRTIKVPDANVDLTNVPKVAKYKSGNITAVLGGLITQPHGLAAQPSAERLFATLVNTSAGVDNGYAAGLELANMERSDAIGTAAGYGLVLWADATNVYARVGNTGLALVLNGTTGVAGAVLGVGNWSVRLGVRAE